ncbi:MAG: 50S ribosomal protein L37ae [Thermoprotei archaeon]|nr:MAG: 50S ribosomal protein L37ae [Thermoprotei archaeon]RLF24391.1 MAG: 50S ribosomal protein L37ae [Thermoprotei archaeon]
MGRRTKVVGPAGRYGARYGATLRKKVARIEMKMRAKTNRCPYCKTMGRLKRISFGIWTCTKCGTTFTGGAYVPVTILGKTFAREEVISLKARQKGPFE